MFSSCDYVHFMVRVNNIQYSKHIFQIFGIEDTFTVYSLTCEFLKLREFPYKKRIIYLISEFVWKPFSYAVAHQ